MALLWVVERIAGRWFSTAPPRRLSDRKTFMRAILLALAGGVVVLLFVLPTATLGVSIYLLTDSVLLTLGILLLVPSLIVLLMLVAVVARCLRRGG